MTYKNAKTILFAGLITALILPFSAMQIANATTEEHGTNVDGYAEYKKMTDKGYKLFPGVGWINSQDDGSVKPVYVQHPDNPDVMLLDLDAMKESIIKNVEANKDISIATHNGYNVAAKKYEENSMTYFNAYWQIPAKPASFSGGTIFYFDSLEPFYGVTFQPVLQYGNSDVCEAGDKWVTFAMIFISKDHYNVTPCVDANVGDWLQGEISESENIWTVKMHNFSTGNTDQVQVGYSENADRALVALETYYLSKNCSSLAGDVNFSYMTITGDSVDWVDGSLVEQWCEMSLNIISDSTVEINNDN